MDNIDFVDGEISFIFLGQQLMAVASRTLFQFFTSHILGYSIQEIAHLHLVILETHRKKHNSLQYDSEIERVQLTEGC